MDSTSTSRRSRTPSLFPCRSSPNSSDLRYRAFSRSPRRCFVLMPKQKLIASFRYNRLKDSANDFLSKKGSPHLSGKEKITDLGGASRGDMSIVQNQFIMNFCLSGLSSTDSHPPKPPFHRPHHDVGLPRAIRSNDAGELVKRTCENGTGELPRFRRCRFHPY